MGEHFTRTGVAGGDRLLRMVRAAPFPRSARLPPRRVRLRDLHRQLRSHRPGDLHRVKTIGVGGGAIGQPQLRRRDQPRRADELPRLTTYSSLPTPWPAPWTSTSPTTRSVSTPKATAYIADRVPLIILAGSDYGSGSSRDWAAKGTMLLGVRADRRELRTHPPIQPDRHGRAAPAVPRRRECRDARDHRYRALHHLRSRQPRSGRAAAPELAAEPKPTTVTPSTSSSPFASTPRKKRATTATVDPALRAPRPRPTSDRWRPKRGADRGRHEKGSVEAVTGHRTRHCCVEEDSGSATRARSYPARPTPSRTGRG